MIITTIADHDDDRLVDYTGLTDVELRTRREPDEGVFVAEGAKVIRRAVAAGYAVRSFFTTARWVDDLADTITSSGAPVYVGSDELLEAVTGYRVHRGALASCERRPLPVAADLLRRARSLVVLEDLVDHTNVGLVFRSAAALGIDAVLLAPRCADPLYRRAIKTSMGATLALPYSRMTNWRSGLDEIRATGFTVLALTPDPAAEPIEAALPIVERVALVLGSEGPGLSSRWMDQADRLVRIPQRSDVDSLNVATAAAIACYALANRARLDRPAPA